VGGERDALDCLERGEADACAVLDLNWASWTKDGTVDPRRFRVLATTDPFDHCVFTVREDFPSDVEERWLKVLFSMTYDDPDHRKMMDMEGLKAWKEGRTSGFGPLGGAVKGLDYWAAGAP
jgi:ABC-type phosphate/phosphonate transport system substrate-binding protein